MITFHDIDRLVLESQDHIVHDAYLEQLCELYKQHVSARFKYYMFLYKLVAERKPFVALEIGVEYGIGSAHMCSAARAYGGTVIGIDIYGHDVSRNQLSDVYGNYLFIEGDSVDAAQFVRPFVECHGMIGIVFQDSSHHYAPSVEEWKSYSPLLDENAVWVCDDITPNFYEPGVDKKSMAEYWNELPFEKKRYPELYAPGTHNCIGAMICG